LTLYLDTSLLVAALTTETSTPRVQAWLAAQSRSRLAISDWVVAEFSAALSVKLRTGELEPHKRATALAAFNHMLERSFELLPIAGLHFRAAARLADQYTLGLRAADALHLAICADYGATLYTLDRRMADAGLALGVGTTLL
jgi:hypothetical protein